MGRGLGTVDQHRHTVGMRYGGHILNRVDGAEHIADMAERRHDRAAVKKRTVAFEVDLAAVVDLRHTYAYVGVAAQQLPGHDVGMMLHDREHDLVAVAETLAVRGGHEVDRLGRAAREDHLLWLGGVDIFLHAAARGLLQVGGLLRQGVYAPVYVGFGRGVHAGDRVGHLAWRLRRRRVVEIYERATVDLPLQNGKLPAYSGYIHCHRGHLLHLPAAH